MPGVYELAARPAPFLFRVPPGEYEVYVVCGTSERYENEFFDFTVSVAGREERVRTEGGYRFRTLRFTAKAGREPLAVGFTPRSRWFVCAVMAWTRADADRVRKEIIAPFEEGSTRTWPRTAPATSSSRSGPKAWARTGS